MGAESGRRMAWTAEATAPPATRMVTAKMAMRAVTASETRPVRTKISWWGRSRGTKSSAPEKMMAAAPRSNMRSMV